MITKNFLKTTKWKFQKALTEEGTTDCKNPGRGWYRIYSFDAKKEFPKEDWYWGLCPTEQLALLMIDFGSFSAEPISEEALANIEEAFAFFRENNKELILRFVYDRKGEGMRYEPSSVSVIQEHMRQLAFLLAKYETTIYCIQGLFIGSWGEMHGSKFLTESALEKLWDTMEKVTPNTTFLAVRTPSLWRQLTDLQWKKVSIKKQAEVEEVFEEDFVREKRLGLFNDGLLGSQTDLGTYKEDEVQKELDFQKGLCKYVPNGGEAVGTAPEGEVSSAIAHFSKIHISYLNSVYDEQVLDRWKNSEYQGMNGYDYIGMHLGYRFVVKDVKLTNRREPVLAITLENKGFSCIYEECRLQIALTDSKGQVQKVDIDTDARQWEPNRPAIILIPLSSSTKLEKMQDYECRIIMKRKKDGHPVRFANKEATNDLLLGRFFQ